MRRATFLTPDLWIATLHFLISLTSAQDSSTFGFIAPAWDSDLQLTVGCEYQIQWATNYTLTNLWVFYGPDADGTVVPLKLSSKTSTTQTTYNWNVTTLVSNGTQYNYHFELENGNDGGCTGCRDNSANFKVSSAGDSPSCSSTTSSAASTTGTAAPSSGTASATTTATVSSTFGSSQQSAAASTGSATSTHSNDHHSYIALGVGLGVGIPLAGIAGGIGWWLWRRSRKTHSVIHNDLADTGLPPYKDMVTGQSPLRKVRSAHSMQEMPSDNVVRQEMPGDHTAHELSGSGAWELDAMSKPSK